MIQKFSTAHVAFIWNFEYEIVAAKKALTETAKHYGERTPSHHLTSTYYVSPDCFTVLGSMKRHR